MAPFFVSFTTPGGLIGFTYGSTVIELPGAPSTHQAVLDLQKSIAMDYGATSAILLTWDFLPDSSSHPSGSSPYGYFLTYFHISRNTGGPGSISILREHVIGSLVDLRFVEEYIRSDNQAGEVHLMSCKALKDPTPQLLQGYEELQRSLNPE